MEIHQAIGYHTIGATIGRDAFLDSLLTTPKPRGPATGRKLASKSRWGWGKGGGVGC